MSTAIKRYYVRMDRIGDGPKINGADSWLCPWRDCDGYLTAAMEQLDEDQPYTVRFTILQMTDEELETYCRERWIEWEDGL